MLNYKPIQTHKNGQLSKETGRSNQVLDRINGPIGANCV